MNKSLLFKLAKYTLFSGLFLAGTAFAVPTGTINFPQSQSYGGNLIISIEAEDPDGLGTVRYGIRGSGIQNTACTNCGTSERETRTGVSPSSIGATPGSNTLELWVEKNGNRTDLDSVTFTWNPNRITNVTTSRVPGSFTVSWNSISGYLRYNLYVSSDENLTPSNVESLANGRAFRALRGTSQVVEGITDTVGMFALVSGVDSSGESAFSDIIRIEALDNRDPITGADAITTNEDTAVSGNVLENDSDPEGDLLTAQLLRNPSAGTVSLNEDGAFTYEPRADFFGNDSFQYTANDSLGGSGIGTVSITVTPVNDAPVAQGERFQTNEDISLNLTAAQGLLANDIDIDGDNLSVVSPGSISAATGVISVSSDGSFSYTPRENFFGSEDIAYTIEDGNGGSASATFTIEVLAVNDPPIANDDQYSTLETVPVTGNVLDNDSDIENDVLTAVLVQTASNGTLNLSSNGQFTYTATPNTSGTDTFTYQVSDGEGTSNIATVRIDVRGVNDVPVAVNDAYSTPEDTTLVVTASNGLLSNDTDADGDPLTISTTPVSVPTSGQLILNADGSFEYTPSENFFGNDSFSYAVTDGFSDPVIATATITITPVNDLPVANDDTYATTDKDTLLISVDAGVLANDSDPDAPQGELTQEVTVSLVSGPQTGVLTLSADGSFEYVPEKNVGGAVQFIYQITDRANATSNATVTINVTDVNDAPVATNDNYTLDEDTVLQVSATEGLLANDTDADGDTLTVLASSISATTLGDLSVNPDGSFAYTPRENVSGTDSFSYRITDGSEESASAVVSLTISPINDIPLAVDDTYEATEDTPLVITDTALGLLANDSDADLEGDAKFQDLAVSLLGEASSGTLSLNTDGTFSFTPEENFVGAVTFSYQVSDKLGGVASANVSINVAAVNDAPVATNDSYEVIEDTTLEIIEVSQGLLANDFDPDLQGDVKFQELQVSLLGEVSTGTITLNTNGTFSYTPEADYFGVATFSYQVSDAENVTAQADVSITVTAVNDPPIVENDSFNATEDTVLEIDAASGVLSNDRNPDGGSLSAVLETGTTLGSIELAEDGSFVYTPTENENGEDRFTYSAINETGDRTTAEVNIVVAAVNDAPVAVNDTATVNERESITINVLDNDSDIDGDNLTISDATASLGTVSIDSNQTTITYTAGDSSGTDTISYTIVDSEGEQASATVTVTINDVNRAPSAQNDVATTPEDNTVQVNVLDNDTDADGDLISIISASAANGIVVIQAQTSLLYTPNANFNGEDTISYTIADPSSLTSSASVLVTVSPVNDTPVAEDDTFSTLEDTSVTISPTENDVDVDGDQLQITAFSGSEGTTVQSGVNQLIYTPSQNFVGTMTIAYTISDGNGGSASATATVTVTDNNQTPVANSDTASVFAGESVDITPLTNDTDGDNETLTITTASADIGSLAISSDATTITYSAPSDTTATATISYTITDTRGATASSSISVAVTEQALTGDFDPDGDGTSDISATTSGNNYVVTFGSDVDSVYYQENGETVSVSTNDSGVYEITVQSNPSPKPDKKDIIIRDVKSGTGVKGVWTTNDFIIGGANSIEIFYTTDGEERSFIISNLDQSTPNIAFGKPVPLATDFSGETEFDFYSRLPSAKGPLRTGVRAGAHYGLFPDSTGFFSGTHVTGGLSWSIVNGEIHINFTGGDEQEVNFLNVYNLDDDASDGVAFNIITKAEADAYVANYNTVFITGFVKPSRQMIRLVRDAKVKRFVDIETYSSYRIDSNQYPEISSANSFKESTESNTALFELLDIQTLKITPLSAAELSGDVVLEIPTLDPFDNSFNSFEYDICQFNEGSPGTGSGICNYYSSSFSWTIDTLGVLTVSFDNGVDVEYRWLDQLAASNTFAIDAIYNFNSQLNSYSSMSYWLTRQPVADSTINNFLTGNYFENSFNTTNPGVLDSDFNVFTQNAFGFYFDPTIITNSSDKQGKRLIGNIDQDNTVFVRDENRAWDVSNGQIKIKGLSSTSSGNIFNYSYDLCNDTADNNCFAWRFRDWDVFAISGSRIWVFEYAEWHDEGSPHWSGSINYSPIFEPRLQFYELTTNIPGAPNSLSFNFEPVQVASLFATTPQDTPLNNIDVLASLLDPENDILTVIEANADNGSFTINTDNTLNYTPNSGFDGTDFYSFVVSEGPNETEFFGAIDVTGPNVAPVANDDTGTAFSGLETAFDVLSNDTDGDNDPLLIDSATVDNGTVTVSSDGTFLTLTTNNSFTGTSTINYVVSDGNGGTDTGQLVVTVAPAPLVGNVDIDNSGSIDFSITNTGTIYTVSFGEDVDSIYYELNGEVFLIGRNANGEFVFEFDANDTIQPILFVVINGVQYSFTPQDISTTPTIAFGAIEVLNVDFSSQSQFTFIANYISPISTLATSFDNGALYDLASGGIGQFSSTKLSDSITWVEDGNDIIVNFDNPIEVVEFWDVYSLDDDINNNGALGVITKAEADAYVAANNTTIIDVHVATTRHLLQGEENNGTYYQASLFTTKRFRIDSNTHPEITSATTGVEVEASFDAIELLDTATFNFHQFSNSDFTGPVYVPIARDFSAGQFDMFSADECFFSGTGSGSGSCVISGLSFNWILHTDGSLEMQLANGITTTLRWLHHGDGEDTVFVKAIDSNADIYSKTDYWFTASTHSISEITSLLEGNYLETSDILSNQYNYDQNNDLIGDRAGGFYFDTSGMAKELNGFHRVDNTFYVQDRDFFWNISSFIEISARSNLSSTDAHRYQYSQCTDSADANCFVWLYRDWIPLAIHDNRIYVMEYESSDDNGGFWDGSLNFIESRSPVFKFYEVLTDIPGSPESISFNQEPVLTGGSISTPEGTTVTIDFVATASDPEADLLFLTDAFTQNGTLIDNGNGTADFTPDSGFVGSTTIEYYISDGTSEVNGFYVVSVFSSSNNAPVANDDNESVVENRVYNFDPITASDTDPDGDTLTVTSVSAIHGSVQINPDNISIDYLAPDSITTTSDTISYTITDGKGAFDSANINISIAANSAPIANNDTDSMTSGSTITIAPLVNDTDADGDILTISSATTTSGSITLASDALSFDFTESIGSGVATINYSISDGFGGSDSGIITVTVTPSNSPPIASNDSFNVTAGLIGVLTPLTNDTDVDSDPLTITSASANDAGATVTISGGGTSLDYINPVAGSDTVTYTISDGNGGSDTATITITINAPNTAPVANNDAFNVTAGLTGVLTPLTNDTDADSDPLTITSASANDTGATVTISGGGTSLDYFNPAAGSDTVTYAISDGNGGSDTATINITINIANSAPVAADDNVTVTPGLSATLTPLSNDTDADSDPLTITAATASNGSVSINTGASTLTYSNPSAGTDTVSYTIADGNGGSDTGTINITINTSPSVNNESYSLSGTSAIIITDIAGVMFNDTDADGDSLSAIVTTLPSFSSTFTLNTDGSFSYTHDGSTNYTDSFSYDVTDGKTTTSGTATLNIHPINFAPEICSIAPRYTTANQNFNFTWSISDADGDTQSRSLSSAPSWMNNAVIDSTTAQLSGTPAVADVGTNSGVTLTTGDGIDEESISFNLTVLDEFGTNEQATFDFGSTIEYVHDAAIDNFGNIVVVGESNGDFAIARLTPYGSLDTTFNGTGIQTHDFGNSEAAKSVAIRPDNSIVVAGDTDNGGSDFDFAVAVYTSTGILDTSFSSDGLATFDVTGSSFPDELADVIVLDNGNITLIGHSLASTYYDFVALQINSSGTINSGFGTSGVITASGVGDVFVSSAKLDNQGYIYVVGHGFNGTNEDILFTRFVAETGSFGGFAAAEPHAPLYYTPVQNGSDEYAYDMAFAKGSSSLESSIIVVGSIYNGTDTDFYAINFGITYDNVNSEYDVAINANFNNPNIVFQQDINSGSNDYAHTIIPDNRGNYFLYGKSNGNSAAVRITANGSLDPSYATGGIKNVTLANGSSSNDSVALIDAFGQLLMIDSEDPGTDARIALTSDYILDPPTFGNCDVTSDYETSSHMTTDEVVDAAVTSTNDFYVVGHSVALDDSNKDFVAIKTTAKGDFDTTWGDNGYARVSNVASSITAHEAIAQNGDQLVIAGVVTGTDNLIMAKFDNKGQLATSFDADGVRDFAGAVNLVPKEMVHLSSNNHFLLMGQDNANNRTWVYRFDTEGVNDLSFGAGTGTNVSDTGVNYTEVQDGNFRGQDMEVLSSGDIYVTGFYFDTVAGYNKAAILKMDQNGLIDTSFGTSGIETFDQGSAFQVQSSANDGTTLYLLGKNAGTSAAYAYKVNASGALDSSFGTAGILEMTGYQCTANSSIQVDSNGLIWVQGNNGGTTEAMVRLTSSGKLDPSFVNGGQIDLNRGVNVWSTIAGFQLDSTNNAIIYGTDSADFAFAPMGAAGLQDNFDAATYFDFGEGQHATNIELDMYSGPVLAGSGYNNSAHDDDMAFAVFDNTGAGSTTFGAFGVNATKTIARYSPNGESTQFDGFDIATNGSFFASAVSTPISGDSDIYLLKTISNTSSQSVNDFSGGLVDINSSSSEDQLGGQYLADTGHTYIVGSTNAKALVYRHDKTGTFDSTFNSLGTLEMSGYTDSHFTAITATSDGDLVAVGYYSNSGDIDGLIVKFSPDGIPDGGFGVSGVQTFNNAGNEDRFNDVAISADGFIIAVGESGGDMLAASYNNAGTLNPAFDTDGKIIADIDTSSDDSATAVKTDQFGGIFILINSNNEFALHRYDNAGALLDNHDDLYGFGPVNDMRDIAIDSLGNVFVTGSVQFEDKWQFFVVRFPKLVGPY